ncbi:RNA-binding S4 domain-containing protein [Solitalea canadensis]|uniref:Ribosome-associated heat shock protein implicated in recycling of 50S subunit n=1 Tax=Solitalea canadensis (strain ATCC 29591 / DSM 3403 / JCM 21819 / LMG 8368 / NBRC 15130 / NCIMB 12057 / USAM 9D) TaxID=929556 RepID=H8KXU9_SOLCM|nr:RNA-binding S4 domain-containing protein [Solitalea canadensis]AFD05625.1 ribosome-associated heat shock protein implicated in recycling of 50S subunit [Solitalea canadensis DSM 3403]
MSENEKLRIDKYLWAIRIFKTRSLATEACKGGKVKLDGNNLKPAHVVKVGDTYHIQKGIDKKIVKVTGLLENRVDAKTAVLYYEDLSPVNTEPRHMSVFTSPVFTRARGTGRPTKRERRDLDNLRGSGD